MTNIYNFAKEELAILKKITPDAVVLEFENEILALCEKFGNSGQSGGSAPYVANAISSVLKKLMLFEPINDIIGDDSEWIDTLESGISKDITTKQNNRCFALFLETTHLVSGDTSRAYYLDAIVWKGVEDWDTFTGRVYYDDRNFELISSKQTVKFPFKPKTFYVDVIRVPITKEEAENRNLNYREDKFKNCYCTILKDVKQLDEVFKYYIK